MHASSTAEGDNDDDLDSASQVDPLLDLQRPLSGVQLYVCCHGSRDTRCGKLGNSLVAVLEDLIQQHQLQNKMQVYKCSHVGGHKVNLCILVWFPLQVCPVSVVSMLSMKVQTCSCAQPQPAFQIVHAMQYAGNVLVYGAMSPCDGDWFGGINERNAAAFLEGIINAEVGCLSPCCSCKQA